MSVRRYMPAYLVEDCRRKETGLYLAPDWTINVGAEAMHLFHESAGVAVIDLRDPASRVVERMAGGGATVGDAMLLAEERWLTVLIDLWQQGILYVNDGSIKASTAMSADRSRYICFEAYLRSYAGPSRTLEQMLCALATSRVCIIGLGGLGATLALSLAASGVGILRLVDGDVVEESNLPRQILYTEQAIGCKKVSTLRDTILANNSATCVEAIDQFVVSQHEAERVVGSCDLVILCADQPRFAIQNWVGKACFGQRIPSLMMAGQWVGPISVPDRSPCHLCIGRFHGTRISDVSGFVNCTTAGASIRASLGPRPLILAGLMASTVIHFLTGIDVDTPLDRRFQVDVMGRVKEEQVIRYRNCTLCGIN